MNCICACGVTARWVWLSLWFQGHSSHLSSLYGVPPASAIPHQHAVCLPRRCTNVRRSGLFKPTFGMYLIKFSYLIIFMLLLSGPRARGCLPFYSNSGCRGPDRQEGSTHQTTCPFRWCVYQGEISSADSVSKQMRFYSGVTIERAILAGPVFPLHKHL